jgi:hypothetical protein
VPSFPNRTGATSASVAFTRADVAFESPIARCRDQRVRCRPGALRSAADTYGSEWWVSTHFGQLLRGITRAVGVAGEVTDVMTAATASVY